jgi:integrase
MHSMPYLIQNSALVWCVQRKVPERLQAAVARILGGKKPTQVYLKKSLATKDRREATRRAPHALADIDRTLREADALVKRPTPKAALRTNLTDTEIKRMAEYVYAKTLSWDERFRFGRDEWKRMEDEHNRLEGRTIEPWKVPYDQMPPHGFSPAILAEQRAQLAEDLKDMRDYLALGHIAAVEDHTIEALSVFGIDLDRKSSAYPKLGMEVLRAYVRALQAIEQRNAGEPVPTPALPAAPNAVPSGTLREAFEGWKKERERPEGTLREYGRAIDLFIQLHGNLPIVEMKRSHARTFREALQLVPRSRKGQLLRASLPELSDYGRAHSTVQKVAPGTVNKQLGAVQAVAGWGRHNGLVPEDAPWSDPFEEMRLEEEQSQREPFDARDLQTIFDAALFTEHKLPVGAKSDAGIWLPLLALFAGARQAEYAGLRVSDIREDEETRVPLMWFTRDTKVGRRLKTKSSERVVPVHPELVNLGFLKYVAARRKEGEHAWLFPTVAPDQKGALRAWSKWWGRHLRTHVGIKDPNKVYHSFRHGFQDALRQATPDEELRDALAGRSSGKSVSRTYGAKEMVRRWGVKALMNAIDKINYPGLDLSRVRPLGTPTTSRGSKRT